MKILLAIIVVSVACSLVSEEIDIVGIGFSVHYSDGWSAHTDFHSDLSVQGAHISGDVEPFVHLVDDSTTVEFWEVIHDLAVEIIQLSPIDLHPDPDPVYRINITFSDGSGYIFEREIGKDFGDQSLDRLAQILQCNERIYIHQKGNGWEKRNQSE